MLDVTTRLVSKQLGFRWLDSLRILREKEREKQRGRRRERKREKERSREMGGGLRIKMSFNVPRFLGH